MKFFLFQSRFIVLTILTLCVIGLVALDILTPPGKPQTQPAPAVAPLPPAAPLPKPLFPNLHPEKPEKPEPMVSESVPHQYYCRPRWRRCQ